MIHVVIVEDDAYLREELAISFTKNGFSVSSIQDFSNPVQEIIALEPDLVVLDLGLPYTSGLEICRNLKARLNIPVLVLTAHDTLSDELAALGFGADDFLTKPCHTHRLIARAERLLQTYLKISPLIQADNILFDPETNKVIYGKEQMILSQTEGALFRMLVEKYPELVPKHELFATLWGNSEFIDENILQVNITRLRKSLETIGLRDKVETVRGKGYRLVTNRQ